MNKNWFSSSFQPLKRQKLIHWNTFQIQLDIHSIEWQFWDIFLSMKNISIQFKSISIPQYSHWFHFKLNYPNFEEYCFEKLKRNKVKSITNSNNKKYHHQWKVSSFIFIRNSKRMKLKKNYLKWKGSNIIKLSNDCLNDSFKWIFGVNYNLEKYNFDFILNIEIYDQLQWLFINDTE